MRYADIQVGQQVLVSNYRPNHPRFNHKNSRLGEVIAKGVPYRYTVTTGGWNSRDEYRNTDEGVVVKLYAYRARGITAGSPAWEERAAHATTTLAAKLTLAEGAALATYGEGRAELAAAEALQAEEVADTKAIILALARHGFEVSFDGRGNLVIDRGDVPRLIEALGTEALA
jgi:hypothetical protein